MSCRFTQNLIGLICFLILLPHKTVAQERLDIGGRQSCLYLGEKLPKKLFKQDTATPAVQIIAEVISVMDSVPDMTIIPANVYSVVAIVEGEHRYLCYSPGFVKRNIKNNKEMLRAAFAHEIAHHYLGHQLLDTFNIDAEEAEADVFAGYVLGKMGLDSLRIMSATPSPEELYRTSRFGQKHLMKEDYSRDWLQGLRQAKALLSLRDNAQFSGPWERWSQFAGLNIFPMPPPKCTGEAPLRQYFEQCQTLGQANDKLTRVLHNTGYQWKYFYVKDGFVAVTKMEQFTADGHSWPTTDGRWNTRRPAGNEQFMSLNYFKSLVFPNPGYFRVFAFVFSPEPEGGQYKEISKKEVEDWVGNYFQGDKLPGSIARLPFSDSVQVYALVYAFRLKESNGKAQLILHSDGEIGRMNHIYQSNIQYFLEK